MVLEDIFVRLMPPSKTWLSLTWAALALSACAGPSLRVESSPDGADVLVARDGEPSVRIGKTPITLNSETAPEIFSSTFKVTVSKDNYLPESLFVPHSSVGGTGRWLTSLKPIGAQADSKEKREIIKDARDVTDSINAIAKGVAEAQQRFFQKNYPAAQRILEELADKYPNIAVIHDLLGNVFYVQKDSTRALSAYKRSYELMPDSIETARMIEKLSQIQGTRKGTGGGN
jgi:hypothetical protein